MKEFIKDREKKLFTGVKMDETLIDYEEPTAHHKDQSVALNLSKDKKAKKTGGIALVNKKDL